MALLIVMCIWYSHEFWSLILVYRICGKCMYNPCRSENNRRAGVCGLCADIIGCFMKGYAVNPFITVAAILCKLWPLQNHYLQTRKKTGKTVGICVSIVVTAVLSSLVLTTAGLVIMLGYNFYAIMPGRLVQFAIMIPIYCVKKMSAVFQPVEKRWLCTSPAVLKNKTV